MSDRGMSVGGGSQVGILGSPDSEQPPVAPLGGDADEFDPEAELTELAWEVVRAWGGHPSGTSLRVARAFDVLSAMALELRDRQVRRAVFHRRESWVSVGRAFGITRQGAQKRWDR